MSNRWTFWLAALWLGVVASPGLLAQKLVRGPYLQLPTQNSMVVRWRTDKEAKGYVRWGLSPESATNRVSHSGSLTEHVVQIRGLQPNTRYYYALGTETNRWITPVEPDYSFITPPKPGTSQPVRVWAIGDPGTASTNQANVRNTFYELHRQRPADLWLMLGDNAYPDGTDAEYQKAVFEMYPSMLRTAPLWPTLGNHDGRSANSLTQSGVYYDIFSLPTMGQAGGVPSGTEAYYSFDHANIHFICLDSNDSPRDADGAMAQWLRADLAATTRDWIVAFFHHPTYTKGTHDSDKDTDSGGRMNDMRANFLPILEAGGVDLILTGHSHNYERSHFIDGHYGKSQTWEPRYILQARDGRPEGQGAYTKPRARTPHAGEISVVTGSAGHASSTPIPLNHPAMWISLNEAGSSIIDINGLKLNFTFLHENGSIRDTFTIEKK